MTNPLSSIGRFFAGVFNAINGGGHSAREDQISEHLKGGMSDANSEAKMGPPPGTGGPL